MRRPGSRDLYSEDVNCSDHSGRHENSLCRIIYRPRDAWERHLHISEETWSQKWDSRSSISAFGFLESWRWSRRPFDFLQPDLDISLPSDTKYFIRLLAVSEFKSKKALQREVCREEACWQLKAWVYELPGRERGRATRRPGLLLAPSSQSPEGEGGLKGVGGTWEWQGGGVAVITSLHNKQQTRHCLKENDRLQTPLMYTRNMRKNGGRLSWPLFIKQGTFSPQNNEQATLETMERGERAWGVVAVITSWCLWLITQLILSFDSFPQACLLCSSHEKTHI